MGLPEGEEEELSEGEEELSEDEEELSEGEEVELSEGEVDEADEADEAEEADEGEEVDEVGEAVVIIHHPEPSESAIWRTCLKQCMKKRINLNVVTLTI